MNIDYDLGDMHLLEDCGQSRNHESPTQSDIYGNVNVSHFNVEIILPLREILPNWSQVLASWTPRSKAE